MDQSAFVGSGKAGSDLLANVGNLDLVELTFSGQSLLQRLAAQVSHRNEWHTAFFVHLMDRDSLDKTKAEIVKLRFFAGREVAEVLNLSTATRERYW